MKYKLYFWNPWNFGEWILQKESEDENELLDIVKRRTLTFIITENQEVIAYKMAPSNHWRYGMVRPKIPEKYPA